MLWNSVRIVFIMWLLAVADGRFRNHKRPHLHQVRGHIKTKEFVPHIDSYCGSILCPNRTHIGCTGRRFQYATICSIDAELLELKEDDKAFILDQFNDLRNQVARGYYNGFTAAGRMATMQWDDELAYLADMHLLQCSVNHDLCRNTLRFKHTGQTTAYKGVMGDVPKLQDIISAQINLWFSESSQITMLDIMEYKGRHIGDNFLQLVLENANRIGCAALQQTKNGWLQIYLTCNYGQAPVIAKPIFTAAAKAGEACIKGMNSDYASLCHIDEDYEKVGGPVDQHNSGEITEQPADEDETTAEDEPAEAEAEAAAGRTIKKARRTNDKATTEENDTEDAAKNESSNVPEEEANKEESADKDQEEEKEKSVAEEDMKKNEKDVMEKCKEEQNNEDIDQNLKSPSSENSDESIFPHHRMHQPIQLTKQRREELLQRKFGRFLALIRKAERFAAHRNILIVTSNHEVDDLKNIKFGEVGRKAKIAERTRKVQAYRSSSSLQMRSGALMTGDLQGPQGSTNTRQMNGQAQWQTQ